jgi:hypothetical protein
MRGRFLPLAWVIRRFDTTPRYAVHILHGHVLRSILVCSILLHEEVSHCRIFKVTEIRSWIGCMQVTLINEIPAEVSVIVLVFVNHSVPKCLGVFFLRGFNEHGERNRPIGTWIWCVANVAWEGV